MPEATKSMFSDRRKGRDRRAQNLPMPSGLDRRRDCRRSRSFTTQPWWLRTNYAAELISESTIIESGFIDSDFSQVRKEKKSTKDKETPPSSGH